MKNKRSSALPNIVSPLRVITPRLFSKCNVFAHARTTLYPSNRFVPLFLNRLSEKKNTLQNSNQLSISSQLSQPLHLPNSFQLSRLISTFHLFPTQSSTLIYLILSRLIPPLSCKRLRFHKYSLPLYTSSNLEKKPILLISTPPDVLSTPSSRSRPLLQTSSRASRAGIPINRSPISYSTRVRGSGSYLSRGGHSLLLECSTERPERERERKRGRGRASSSSSSTQGTLLGRRRYTPRSGVAGETRYTEKYRVPTQETDSA